MSEFDDNEWNDEEFDDFDKQENFVIGQEFDSDMGGIPIDYIDRWKQSEFEIKEQEINLAILNQSIVLAQKSWFWFLKSASSRLAIIHNNYYALLDMVKS